MCAVRAAASIVTGAESGVFRILLVEDNPLDARATRKAIEASDHPCLLEVAEDGDTAIARLRDESLDPPDLVLLDLNLPGRDGFDVLDDVKTDAVLRRIPILVLTTSANQADVAGAYDRGANAYLNKPPDLSGWRQLVDAIQAFWFIHVQFPPP